MFINYWNRLIKEMSIPNIPHILKRLPNIWNRISANHYEASAKPLDLETVSTEVEHHNQFADQWWDTNGPMKALHSFNVIRVPFIRDGLISRGYISPKLLHTTNVLKEQKILEVGCGGGILTEQLARIGAIVTGIDLSKDLIETACNHLTQELKNSITYKRETVEKHVEDHIDFYDAVVVSEVLEHIDDKVAFLNACVKGLKHGGSIFITTINQTWMMWLGGVLIAEYILNLLPKGTHHWHKMISPINVQRILDTMDCQTVLVNGCMYDFWRDSWRWINTTNMCYTLQAVKVKGD